MACERGLLNYPEISLQRSICSVTQTLTAYRMKGLSQIFKVLSRNLPYCSKVAALETRPMPKNSSLVSASNILDGLMFLLIIPLLHPKK
jgi:hypothetical protein